MSQERPTPKEHSQDQLILAMRRAYFTLNRHLEAMLADSDITGDQYRVLLMLVRHGDSTQKGLGERLLTDPSTLGAIVRLMEKHGLVLRKVDPQDARARQISLTAKGRGKYRSILPKVETLRERATGMFSKSEQTTFLRMLRQIEQEFLPTEE